jgi:hypothetical protein
MQTPTPLDMTPESLKAMAAQLASEMRGSETPSADVRARFIRLRAALFQRGVYDPVLVRFDSATAPRATTAEIAGQLEKISDALG